MNFSKSKPALLESKNFVTNNVLYLKYLTNTSFLNNN